MNIDALYLYPLKSARGIRLEQAEVLPTGFKHDRAWMIIDDNGKFMSARLHREIILIDTSLDDNGLTIRAKDMPPLIIPFEAEGAIQEATIWNDTCLVQEVSIEHSHWISNYLKEPCKIVKMKQGEIRPLDERYRKSDRDHTLFADGFPFLFTATASLKELERKTGSEIEMIRFRPNIVLSTVVPFEEDTWKMVQLGMAKFHLVKPCSRCSIVNVDPSIGKRGDEPLKTLGSFRKVEKKIFFGVNAIPSNTGFISINDKVSTE